MVYVTFVQPFRNICCSPSAHALTGDSKHISLEELEVTLPKKVVHPLQFGELLSGCETLTTPSHEPPLVVIVKHSSAGTQYMSPQ